MTPEVQYEPIRILFVFAWLVVGGEETEVRLLARRLDPRQYRIDVVACFRKPGMSEMTHVQLKKLGVDVDCAPYTMSFEDTVAYLARKIAGYDIIVSCQNVADIYPALQRLHFRPPLIEHGGLISEALAGPKHFTSRYVGVCRSIRDAAAAKMPGREQHAIEIPSMVDLSDYHPEDRARMRASLGIGQAAPVVGWAGRLDKKKRVEDFIEAAARVHRDEPEARFLVIGGPDAFMPDYADQLRVLAGERGLAGALVFLGDRDDVPALLSALDVFVWLSRGEGMPHVIAEAGAAGLAVVATSDNGAAQQIKDRVSGIFVPHERPDEVAAAILTLVRDPVLRSRLGSALRSHVACSYSVDKVVPKWERLFREVLAERQPAPLPNLFASFFQGGFECSTHRRRDGRRLDLIASTGHDTNALGDYRQLAKFGMRTLRDGVRWHLIEKTDCNYDWSSFLPMLRASRAAGAQVIWDLLHYGWPDDLDIWTPAFVTRFARFARATARIVREESSDIPFYCPVNEISFMAWAGGDVAYFNPFAKDRGFELKAQLASASIAAMQEILVVDPRARFVHCEPAISISWDPTRPDQRLDADRQHEAQYQAWDMIAGNLWPQLGGSPRLLDIIGVNYYFDNQWPYGQPPIDIGNPLYKPFRRILMDNYARYGRPLFVSETGIEGDRRPTWLSYIVGETEAARTAGVSVEGICLYPILDHFGWDDDRPCPNGLLGGEVSCGQRLSYGPLADEIGIRSQAASAGDRYRR